MMQYDDFEPPEESELQKKIKKIVRGAIAIFLLILVLGLVIPADVIHSMIASRQLQDFTMQKDGLTIVFEPEAYGQLKQHYLSHQLTELKFCLQGTVHDTIYTVTSFYLPKVIFASPISVHAIRCDDTTIIDLHTHPFRNCVASQQDVYSHSRRTNKNMLSMIMCDTNRFAIYGW